MPARQTSRTQRFRNSHATFDPAPRVYIAIRYIVRRYSSTNGRVGQPWIPARIASLRRPQDLHDPLSDDVFLARFERVRRDENAPRSLIALSVGEVQMLRAVLPDGEAWLTCPARTPHVVGIEVQQ